MAKEESKSIAKAEKKSVAKKSDKPGFFARISKFFKEVTSEVKKLSWPNRKELVSYTLTVLAFIAIFAIVIYACDLLFTEGFNLLSKI